MVRADRAVTRLSVIAVAATVPLALALPGCARPAPTGGAETAPAAAQDFLRALGTADAKRFCALVTVAGQVAGEDDLARCERAGLLDTFRRTTSTAGLPEAVVTGVTKVGEERASLDPAQVSPKAAQDFVGRTGGSIALVRLGDRWYVTIDEH